MVRQVSSPPAFYRQPDRFKIRSTAAISVAIMSMTPVLPFVVTTPVLPPLGFMTFLTWRLLQREIWYPWAGVLLGLNDDLWSGAPLGSGMLLWTFAQTALTIIDRRLLWRDFWQDWAIAALLIALIISGGLLIANFTGGHTPGRIMIPQILIAIGLQPLLSRGCAALDRWRLR